MYILTDTHTCYEDLKEVNVENFLRKESNRGSSVRRAFFKTGETWAYLSAGRDHLEKQIYIHHQIKGTQISR